MKFSIIIPLYNKAKYIEKALLSVLNQTYQEFEVIVVDDGSTDIAPQPPKGGVGLTYLYLEQLIGKKGKLISQKNSGVSTARNNGVKAAKYDYIAFLDADDWWEPTFLEEMKELIEEYPNSGIYGSSYYKVKNGKNIPANIGVEDGFERGKINYFRVYANSLWMPLWTGAVIIPKKVFTEEKGFKPQLKLGEDFDLWVRIAVKYPVVLLNKPLAYYNQDVEQASRGVVMDKIYLPDTHFIFNLDYLSNEERTNPDCKEMLDVLRVYTLFRYRMQKKFWIEYQNEINKVDFGKQPFRVKLQYKLPRLLVKNYYKTKNIIRNLIK